MSSIFAKTADEVAMDEVEYFGTPGQEFLDLVKFAGVLVLDGGLNKWKLLLYRFSHRDCFPPCYQ